jgi:predicted dehydrogenase
MAVSVALVGLGYWGKKLLPKFLSAPDCAVRLLCDLVPAYREEAERSYPRLSTTASYDEVLADPRIDAVVLATPPASHFSLAEKAIEAGKHLWIEKPLALHLDEGNSLVRLAEAKKSVLFVDHTFLYDRGITAARELIGRGELGEIYHVFMQRSNLGRIKRDSNVWWNSAPHDVSILLYLMPAAPAHITLQGYRYLQPQIEDLNMAVVEFADGASAFIYHNWLYPENSARLTIVGSKKFFTYEGKFDKRAASLFEYVTEREAGAEEPGGVLPVTIPSKITAERKLEGVDTGEPLAAAVADFLESIRERRPPVSDGRFSLKVLAVLEAAEESLRSGGKKISLRP